MTVKSPITDFHPLIRTHAPSVPIPLLNQFIIRALSLFCEKTKCWREVLNYKVNGDDDCIPLPDGTTLVAIERLTIGTSRTLSAIHYRDIAPSSLHLEPQDGAARCFTQQQHDQLTLVPAEKAEVEITVFIKPKVITPTATSAFGPKSKKLKEIPSFILAEYAEEITSGVLGFALMTPNTEYYDPKMAIYHKGIFQQAIDKNKHKHHMGDQRARTRNRSSFF